MIARLTLQGGKIVQSLLVNKLWCKFIFPSKIHSTRKCNSHQVHANVKWFFCVHISTKFKCLVIFAVQNECVICVEFLCIYSCYCSFVRTLISPYHFSCDILNNYIKCIIFFIIKIWKSIINLFIMSFMYIFSTSLRYKVLKSSERTGTLMIWDLNCFAKTPIFFISNKEIFINKNWLEDTHEARNLFWQNRIITCTVFVPQKAYLYCYITFFMSFTCKSFSLTKVADFSIVEPAHVNKRNS